uniref:Uncharacterized protein n=1 Tax=Licmophora sp. TaxID=2115823 RepID=A0A2U9NNU6_9STRA|nr:hypothetical protein ycf88 [Licmophora sp.]
MKTRPWKPCLVNQRCSCSEILVEEKKNKPKSNRTGLSEGKPLVYPTTTDLINSKLLKTFQIKYEGTLTIAAKSILNSFQNKYIYYAIDDILYLLDSKSKEQESLLAILYSSMLSLHNDFSINFFDIWVDSIYVHDTYKKNRLLENNSKKLKHTTYITLKLYYIARSPIKKAEPIW